MSWFDADGGYRRGVGVQHSMPLEIRRLPDDYLKALLLEKAGLQALIDYVAQVVSTRLVVTMPSARCNGHHRPISVIRVVTRLFEPLE